MRVGDVPRPAVRRAFGRTGDFDYEATAVDVDRARGSAGERRRGRPPGRGDRQRHLRVRRRRRAAVRPRAARPLAPTARGQRALPCSSPAASRSPRSPAAARRSRGDGSWRDAQVAGLRADGRAPHARWSVTFDAEDGQGFALEFAALGEPVASEPGARRDGGLRAAVPGARAPCAPAGASRRSPRSASAAARGATRTGTGSSSPARVGAWTDAACAALTAVRPAGASNHAEESVWAALLGARGRRWPIEDGRLSTTYDGEGRMRRAGLELWPADDGGAGPAARPARCSAAPRSTSGALRLDCAFFRWHLEGRTGVGRYDILRRAARRDPRPSSPTSAAC